MRAFTLCARLAFAVAVSLTLAASGAAAQDLPVVFVHGISSSDLTWTEVATALRDDGYGEPTSVHIDLNASDATDAASDVVWSEFVPFGRVTGQVARRQGPPASLAGRHYYVNFRAWSDGSMLNVHAERGAEGRSESNESGIVNQGRALDLVIADVLAATSAPRVILVGHSMGGLAIRSTSSAATPAARRRGGWARWRRAGTESRRSPPTARRTRAATSTISGRAPAAAP